MTHTARCDNTPFRRPTEATITLCAPGRQWVIRSTGAMEKRAWSLAHGPRVFVSATATTLVRFYAVGDETESAACAVPAGTTAIDLPPGVVFGCVGIESPEGTEVRLWTSN